MKEIPLYGGPSLRTAKADPGTAARAANGDQGQMLGGSIQKAEEALQGSAEAFARISDFGEMQRQEVELRRIRDESDAEFSRMLAYAPGTKDSVFNNDGSIIKGRLDDLAFKFGQRIESLGGTFFSPEVAMKARGVMESVKASLPERYWGLAAKHQLSVARQAFETNLKLAEEKEDWGGYESSVMGGVQSQVISPAEGELRLLRGRKKASLQNFNNLAATNPAGAYDLLDSEDYKNRFSPYELDAMRRKLASQARPAAADSFFNSFVLTRKKDKGKSGTKNDGPEWTGFYTKKECGWIRAFEAGKGAIVRPQIAAAAAEEARAFNPSLSQEESEVARDAYIQKYSRFGLEKEWLGRQWTAADDMRKKLKTPTIDIKGRLNLLEKKGTLLNQQAFNAENQPYSDEEGWKSGGKFRDEFMGQLGLTPTETNKSAMAKYMAYARANHAAGLRSQISERFHSWRENDGKDATQAEQQAKLISLTREITGNRDISFVDEGVNQMDSNIANARDAQRSRFAQWAVKSGRKYWVDSSAQEAPMQRVSLGFDSTRKDLPAGILLPREMVQDLFPTHAKGMIESGNIDLSARPVVRNADGSISTVRSISVGIDGKEYLIPTVSEDGKVLSEDDAVKQFKKTGKHLGVFDSPEDATAYARRLHEGQDVLYGDGLKDYVVEATFDNEHFRRFRVVGTCEGDSPQMSYAVARQGFYDAGRSFAVDMRIIKGDTDELMKQQDAALPTGKAVKINKSALRGLAPYEQAFYDAGKKYGVDPKLLIAIAMHETGKGTSPAFLRKNNAMGISPNGGGPRDFSSVEESIDYAARLLRKHYLDKGLTTIAAIGGKYAPVGADNDPRNLNQHWAKGVRKYYNSL